jgi:hypothetical protein
MNLTQVQALKDLYPPLRLRSGRQVETTQMSASLKGAELTVVIKTVFPPSSLRRSEIAVTAAAGGALRIRALDPVSIGDAQAFAQRLRERGELEQEQQALKLVKEDGALIFVVAPVPAAPADKTEKGGS